MKSVYDSLQNNTTLLEDENQTVEEAGIEDGQQVLIEGTVKFLNFRAPENFAVIITKLEKRCFTIEKCIKKMQKVLQIVKTLIRLL